MNTLRAALGLLTTALVAACASGGLGTGEEPVEEQPNNDDPTPNNDPANNNDPDSCGESCAVGRFICIGEDEIHVCRQTPDGCAIFVLNETCSGGRICLDALCVEPDSCVDTDGDLHGLNCEGGADCDDRDPERHEDARELCDGIDNDCDGIEDEGDACDADCTDQECDPGETECTNATSARQCRAGNDGCGAWSPSVSCGDGQCVQGACQDANCVDNDGDLRGQGCAFGADCDDNNRNRFEGNRELCDGLDNDCDGDEDEGFDDFGQPCEIGVGACRVSGIRRCAPGGATLTCDATPIQPRAEICGNGQDDNCNGQTDEGFAGVGQACESGQGSCRRTGRLVCDGAGSRCDASPGAPSQEVCDGQDNDCNGQADDGGVCTGCTNDAHEPDQRSSQGFLLARGASTTGTLCGEGRDGSDWVRLGRYNNGETIRVTIEFNNASSFMHMEVYNPDFAFIPRASDIQNTGHTLTVQANKTGDYFLWLFPNDNPEPGISYTLRNQ